MTARTTPHPTSVRLSAECRALLAEASRVMKRSQSQVADETLKRHLPAVIAGRQPLTVEQKLGYLRDLLDKPPVGGGRTMAEIDAEIRDMRRDRF